MGVSILAIILISMAISIIISLLFRTIDKSNQQLSKLKLFVEKSIKELDAFVVEKKQAIKDLAIDIDFSIKQAQSLQARYEKQHGDIMLFFSKFQEQKQEIDLLKKSIRELGELKDSIASEISKLENFGNRIEQFKKELVNVENQCNSLGDSLISKQESMREQVENYLIELHEKANSVIQQNAKMQFEKLKIIESELIKKVEELKEEFGKKVLTSIHEYDRILAEHENKVNISLDNFDDRLEQIKENFNSFENNISQLFNEKEKEFEDSILRILKNNEIRIEEKIKSLESIRNSINLLHVQLEEKVELFDDTLSSESEKMLENFNKDLLNAFAEKTKKIEEYLLQSEKQLIQVTQKIDSIQDAVDKIIKAKVSDVGKYVTHLEQRIANYQETIYKEIEKKFTNLDLDARAIVEQSKNELSMFNSQSLSEIELKIDKIEKEIEDILKQQNILKDEYLSKFQSVIKENEEKLNYSINSFSEKYQLNLKELEKKLDVDLSNILAEKENKIKEFETYFSEVNQKLINNIQNITDGFEKRKEELKENIEQFELKIPQYLDEMSKKINQYELKINNLVEMRISEVTQSLLNNQDKYIKDFENIYKEFSDKGNNFIQEIILYKNNLTAELKNFNQKKEEVFSELDLIKSYINESLERYDQNIEEKVKEMNIRVSGEIERINNGRIKVEEYLESFEKKKKEIDEEINNIKDSIFQNIDKINKENEDRILKLENDINQKINETLTKFSSYDQIIEENSRKINEKIVQLEKAGEDKIESVMQDIIKRMDKEKEYIVFRIPELYKQLEEFESSFEDMKNKANLFDDIIKNKIENVNIELQKYFDNIKELNIAKINEIENNIEKLEHRLKSFGNEIENKYLEDSKKFDLFCQRFQEESNN
ncbi:MAG: SpiroCoCo family coiled-coil protein, partial [Exilispira sp.]